MKIDALNLNTEHFIVEHLQGSPGNRQLIDGFVAPNAERLIGSEHMHSGDLFNQ